MNRFTPCSKLPDRTFISLKINIRMFENSKIEKVNNNVQEKVNWIADGDKYEISVCKILDSTLSLHVITLKNYDVFSATFFWKCLTRVR